MKMATILFGALITSGCLNGYTVVSENSKTQKLGYGDWYIQTDGELDLMRQLLQPADVVFDVGANVGEWSLCALGVEPTILLYSFEPLPAIFPDLQAKLLNYPNAKTFNLALSDVTGIGKFCYYDETYDFSALSSFYEREVLKADHQPPQIIDIAQESLSHFCEEQAVDKIDFLKIDAEGAEWVILKGALPLIETGKISAIQFEYGGCFIDAKTSLKEIFTLLLNYDYLLFRIMPNGLIRIPKWDDSLENFKLSNYFAIKKDAASARLRINN